MASKIVYLSVCLSLRYPLELARDAPSGHGDLGNKKDKSRIDTLLWDYGLRRETAEGESESESEGERQKRRNDARDAMHTTRNVECC